jgi:two-component system OmpR family sensor kinase
VEFTTQPEDEEVWLGDLTEVILGQLKTEITDRHLAVSVSGPDPKMIAPSSHLSILVRNLLENAVHYSTRIVAVEVSPLGWMVFNTCEIAEGEDLDKWFEPLYRSPGSATPGSGLGLAICRAVCSANGWQLQLERIEAGLRASLSFGRSQQDRR